jgi:hypothetical protein
MEGDCLSAVVWAIRFPVTTNTCWPPGTLDEATLQRFREGMVNANKEVMARQMLTLWKLTGFEPVPEDYDAVLTNIIKPYPPPAGTASK